MFNGIAARPRKGWYLSLEYLVLRHQLEVLQRSAKRPQFSSADRGLWLILSSVWSRWPQAVEIMQADTVQRWRRQGLRHHFWWQREHKRPGRPPIASDTRELIREMSRDNRLWGTPLNLPIMMRKAEVSLDASLGHGWVLPPKTKFISQDLSIQKSGTSEQAVA